MTGHPLRACALVLLLAACGPGEGPSSDGGAPPDAPLDAPVRIACDDPRCRAGCCPDFDGGTYCCDGWCNGDGGVCRCGSGPACEWDTFCCGARGIELYGRECVDYERWLGCHDPGP